VAPGNSPFDAAIIDGENGRLVRNTRKGWEDAIAELLKSQTRRAQLAAGAVRDVKANHVLSRTVPILRAALTALAETSHRRDEAHQENRRYDTHLGVLAGASGGSRPWTPAPFPLASMRWRDEVLMRMVRLSRSRLGGLLIRLFPRRVRDVVGKTLAEEP
jgi:hypothetical protein